MSKYHNQKVYVDGKKIDSKREAARYKELLLMQRAGLISDLKTQVKYMLIPTQRDEKGNLLFKKRFYIADFVYRDKDGNLVVEDAKGVRTEVYKLKRALMYREYGILIREV